MNTASSSGSGSLPSNTVANPRGDLKAIITRGGISYDGPPIPPPLPPLSKVVERETDVTKDTVQPSTKNIQPPVLQTQAPIDEPVVAPNPKPSIHYPSRANKQNLHEKDDNLALKFIVECLALADLGASINLMPLSIWKKLSVPKLTPTRMILELADLSTTSHPGIDPSFCTHKILMEDDLKPAIQDQRRVNPKIHEVIKKEVIKLLDAGLIYPIFDSPWVNPVHCVPKKGGMTVVENEDNELIPTSLVTGWHVCIDYRKLNDHPHKDPSSPFAFYGSNARERLAGNK
ncbi:hypothetical protein Tco_0699475 [Tanacetum coccineum]